MGGAQAKLAVNSLPPEDLFDARSAAAVLADHKLAGAALRLQNPGELHRYAANLDAVGAMVATDEGINVLSFIVSCALPTGTTLVVSPFPDGDLEFIGALGLAEGWVNRKLNADEQGWVSACVLARTTISDIAASLSLRGPHKALGIDAAEATAYPLEEGAFYGNYFDPKGGLYACRGADKATGPQIGFIQFRHCAEPDPGHPEYTFCGYVYTGECGNYAPAPGPACEKVPGDKLGYYEKYHDQPIVKHRKSEKFDQVISVYDLDELGVVTKVELVNPAGAKPVSNLRSKMSLSGNSSTVAQLDAQSWTLAKTGSENATAQTVTWDITATLSPTGSKRLQVTGKTTLKNGGNLPATVGNVVVILQHRPNGAQWATAASDVADATSGDAATAARLVRRNNAPADDSTLVDDDDLNNNDPYSVYLVTETAGSGALSLTNSAGQPLSVAQLTLAPGQSLTVNFTATFNNDVLNLPVGRKVRAELNVSFGNADGGHKAGFNVDINGNGSISTDEAKVKTASARLGDKSIPAPITALTPVAIADQATDITTTGTVSYSNVVFTLGATTGTVTANVLGGTAGGTIKNCAHLTGTGTNLQACSELAVAAQAHEWRPGEVITYSQEDWGDPTTVAGQTLDSHFFGVYIKKRGQAQLSPRLLVAGQLSLGARKARSEKGARLNSRPRQRH